MAYSELTDYMTEMAHDDLARLTGNPTGQAHNVARLVYAIEISDNEIDAFLKGRYQVPFDPLPRLINSISISLTFANLYTITYPRTMLPMNISNRRDNAYDILKKLQTGEMVLERGNPSQSSPPPIFSNKTNVTKPLKSLIIDFDN